MKNQILKMPRKKFTPDPCHWTKCKYNKWKQKIAYDSEEDANLNLKDKNMCVYICPICNKWHIGHKQFNNK